MGPGKNVHSYNQDNKGAFREDCQPLLDAKFRPKEEAKAFVKFFLRGEMTLKQCNRAILMTKDQYNWLIKHGFADPVTLREVHRRRLRVWDAFLTSLRKLQHSLRTVDPAWTRLSLPAGIVKPIGGNAPEFPRGL